MSAPDHGAPALRLYGLRVFVDDLEAARQFYGGRMGLPLLWEFAPALGFDLGATLIVEALAPDDPERARLVGRFVGCSLEVADIEAAHDRLSARGVDFLGPPARQPWGGILAHFRDPAGNILTLFGP